MSTSIRKSDPVDQQEEIVRLRTRLETHIQDYRDHVLEEERRYLQDMQKQAAMSANIEGLVKAFQQHGETTQKNFELQAKTTEGLVNAWNALAFFQKFVKWLSGFAAIGVFIAWYNDLFTK